MQVCCRVRPFNKMEESTPEYSTPSVSYVETEGGATAITCRAYHHPTGVTSPILRETGQFEFSHIFTPATQHDLYHRVGRPVVADVMNGYNGTVFVYGQTGSGKTYTIFGDADFTFSPVEPRKGQQSISASPHVSGGRCRQVVHDNTIRDSISCETRVGEVQLYPLSEQGDPLTVRNTKGGRKYLSQGEGIVPRAVQDLFQRMARAGPEFQFEVLMFLVEVYMEQARDLLSCSTTQQHLQVREDVANSCFYVEGCETPYVSSAKEMIGLIQKGLHRRSTFSTNMNETSSRSHCILNITVKSYNSKLKESKVGKLFLVDLAGSEKVSKTKSSGVRLEEAKLINKSLSNLGMVISALSDRAAHVPYRDSVLTKILKDSLGGNSRTTLVICCSPSVYNSEETMSTLRFGARAKSIQNRAVVNRQLTMEELHEMLRIAKMEIARLQSKLRGGNIQSGTAVRSSTRLRAREALNGRGSGGTLRRERALDDSSRFSSDRPLSAHPRVDSDSMAEIDKLLRDRAYDAVQFNNLSSELHDMKDKLKGKEEIMNVLSAQRDDFRDQVYSYEEEITIWEEEYTILQHYASAQEGIHRELQAGVVAQQAEIQALLRSMSACIASIQHARIAVEEMDAFVFGPGVSSQWKRTLMTLQRQQSVAPLLEGTPVPKTRVNVDPSEQPNVEGSPDAQRPRDFGVALTAVPLLSISPSDNRGSSPLPSLTVRLLGASSTASQELPTATKEVMARHNTPRLESTEMIQQPLCPPSNAKEETQRSATGEQQSPFPIPAVDTLPQTELSDVPMSLAISSGGAQRIVELEEQVCSLEKTLFQLRSSYTNTCLELELAEKKLSIRQERLNRLRSNLQSECTSSLELRQMLEKERATHRSLLQTARSDSNYWRRRYEELSKETRQQERLDSYRSLVGHASSEIGSSLSTEGLTPRVTTHVLKTVRGGSTHDEESSF